MFEHILLPTDGSELSARAVKQTIKLAKAVKARITALHVVRDYRAHGQEGYVMPELELMRKLFLEQAAVHAQKILGRVKTAASAAGVKCVAVVAVGNSPYAIISKQAKASGCDLIMMATHGRRGVPRLLHGSEAAKVLTHSKIPVLVLY